MRRIGVTSRKSKLGLTALIAVTLTTVAMLLAMQPSPAEAATGSKMVQPRQVYFDVTRVCQIPRVGTDQCGNTFTIPANRTVRLYYRYSDPRGIGSDFWLKRVRDGRQYGKKVGLKPGQSEVMVRTGSSRVTVSLNGGATNLRTFEAYVGIDWY
jgi:hypothetical protein